jgi:hypothetical protein
MLLRAAMVRVSILAVAVVVAACSGGAPRQSSSPPTRPTPTPSSSVTASASLTTARAVHPDPDTLYTVPAALLRPLHPHSVASACRTEVNHFLAPAFGPGLGHGPIYPAGTKDGVVRVEFPPPERLRPQRVQRAEDSLGWCSPLPRTSTDPRLRHRRLPAPGPIRRSDSPIRSHATSSGPRRQHHHNPRRLAQLALVHASQRTRLLRLADRRPKLQLHDQLEGSPAAHPVDPRERSSAGTAPIPAQQDSDDPKGTPSARQSRAFRIDFQ